MQLILLEKIRKLGTVGDKVTVKRGYGRNYLIPTGKAIYATPAKIAEFESRRSELEKNANDRLSAAKVRAEKLEKTVITIRAKAADEGKLFGSIGTREISKAFAEAGYQIEKSEISLPEGVIRRTGEYAINLQLHSDVIAVVKINIIAEESAE